MGMPVEEVLQARALMRPIDLGEDDAPAHLELRGLALSPPEAVPQESDALKAGVGRWGLWAGLAAATAWLVSRAARVH